MEPLNGNNLGTSSKNKSIGKRYILTGVIILLSAFSFGLVGALQYTSPGLFKNVLSFEKVRPLHVSSAVFWILLAACGSVTHYLAEVKGKLWSVRLSNVQWYLFTGSIILILLSYLFGIFGGREYWEFHPLLAGPIILAWLFFIINVFKSIGSFRNQPVYVWMWMTGVVFFLFTFLESYLWLIPSFRSDVVKDMTIQWKSYGSMVGGWNMLIYGCSIYLMDKISGSQKYSYSKIAFTLYFLGLFNLMFNWGHHIYTLPAPKLIQYISYGVSMTELLLLGRIIYFWRSSVNTLKKNYHILPYRFLFAADLWIFLTLLLAIVMSIPAINIYTHGTHITVAHTMGATIGINSFLLLSFTFDIFNIHQQKVVRQISLGLYLSLASLFIFWLSLIIAGVLRADWQMHSSTVPFSVMMLSLRPYFIVFLISGVALFTGFFIIIFSLLRYHLSQKSVDKTLTLKKIKTAPNVLHN
ncbi:MAG: Cytochrome c oxidase subunit CcoN [Cytophagales bacterium]|jgi:nitric oxide reductase subunit B|nr:cbb3-type cytochrome c oxidase subunit I [Bacteroidota bacterium]MBS1982072.1 cbb3-type cytochrome c oxidase subunit I [Bacteroidota bacterium]WHZ06457.1 MAG: Cytochrome c oxidase subunit CcoN [Cytophagales bacterium]